MEPIISTEDCQNILNLEKKSEKLLSFFLQYQPKFNGLSSKIYELVIDCQYENAKKTKIYLAKTKNKSNIIYNVIKSARFFQKEKLYLSNLVPRFLYRGLDPHFAPKVFLFNDDLIVMENLMAQNYQQIFIENSFDLEHIRVALKTLAVFHSTGIIYEICLRNKNGGKYDFLREHDLLNYDIYSGKNKYMNDYLECAKKSLCKLVPIVFGNKEIEDFVKKLKKFDLTTNALKITHGIKSTILHGDLKANNFLFKYHENKPTEAKLIDYQCLNYGPPTLDVLQLIFSNTRKHFRDEHMRDLLKFYHDTFTNLLYQRALYADDFLPREEFFHSCELLKGAVKLRVVIDRSISCLPTEAYEKLKDDAYERFLYEDRSEIVVEAFENNVNYWDVLREDLMELRKIFAETG